MKKSIVVAIAVLALCGLLAANQQLVVIASEQTVYLDSNNGPQVSLVSALCSNTPCAITWIAMYSNNKVGSISNTSGPQTTFTAGSKPGTAYIFARDTSGHTAQVIVYVAP
jgi:hypothetical protein